MCDVYRTLRRIEVGLLKTPYAGTFWEQIIWPDLCA